MKFYHGGFAWRATQWQVPSTGERYWNIQVTPLSAKMPGLLEYKAALQYWLSSLGR